MDRRDRWPWAEAAALPAGLSEARLWRWCVLRTIRDARLARARGRRMGRGSMERLFARRWSRADPDPDHAEPHRMKEQHGRALIRRAWENGMHTDG